VKDANVTITRVPNGRHRDIAVEIELLDPALFNQSATLEIIRSVKVHDDRGVDDSSVVWKLKFVTKSTKQTIWLDSKKLQSYSYKGKMIDVDLSTRIKFDDGLIFDTKVEEEQSLKIAPKPPINSNSSEIMDPKDDFNFIANLKAVPPEAQIFTAILLMIGVVGVLGNTFVGLHDQFVSEALTWFYSHTDSDGDSQSPLMSSIVVSFGFAGMIWAVMRKQLQRYMKFHLAFKYLFARPGTNTKVSDLIRGRSRVPLENIELRIVACNMEQGQYKRGSGTSERTVSFNNPIRGIVLYRKKIKHIPAQTPIHRFFPEQISFDKIYESLYPPQVISSTHGLLVRWEVQLIHNRFVDQELVGPVNAFKYEFFTTPRVQRAPPKKRSA
jgi:hypothetical protein